MDYKRILLGAASVLALTAGLQAAEAAVPPGADAAVQALANAPAEAQADLLFDFVGRTNGSFTDDAVEQALSAMFNGASREQIASIPDLIASLPDLGMDAGALDNAKGVLVDIVASASSIDNDMRAALTTRIEDGGKTIQLAQADNDYTRRPRDPREVGATGGGYQ